MAVVRLESVKHHIHYIPQSSKGLRYFLVRHYFFFFYIHFHKTVHIAAFMRSSFGERIFYLSENGNGCRLTYSGTLPAGDLRPSGFSRKFRRNGGLTAWTLVRKKYGFVVNS